MNLLESEVKHDKIDETTVEDALRNQEMVNDINYWIQEGFIELEEDADGNIRAYPTSR